MKAGLHVLASDWLQSKRMMSFLDGRCVSSPMHTHIGELNIEILVHSRMRVKMRAWKGGWMDRVDDEREIFKETVILVIFQKKKRYYGRKMNN